MPPPVPPPQPNFLIVGRSKAGTTSLWAWLRQHPQVFMTVPKELHYFSGLPSWRGARVSDWQTYLRYFDGAAGHKAIGEASPSYMAVPDAAQRIHAALPEARILIMLRHPADRAYSAYTAARMLGRERLDSFREAVDASLSGRYDDWRAEDFGARGSIDCLSSSYSAEATGRFIKLFGKHAVKVCLFDDLVRSPQGLFDDVCDFLGIDTGVAVNQKKENATGQPLSARVQRGLRKLRRHVPGDFAFSACVSAMNLNVRLGKPWPKIDPDIRAELSRHFKPDIVELQQLIDRDLSPWLADA